MIDPGFLHLRVHTAYSLSEGAIRIRELVDLCRKHAMPAVAITDRNNLFGGMDASAALRDAGIQPIIGCQLGIARTDDDGGLRARGRQRVDPDELLLIVQNATGYRNLLHLLADAHENAAALGAPQVPRTALAAHAEGLIVLSGGVAGPVGRLLAGGQADAAATVLSELAACFPDRLYVELQRHGLDAEAAVEAATIDLADRLGLPLVATNEAFFPDRQMFDAHDALICIAEGAYLGDQQRRRLTPEHYFKSPAEMRELFADLPDACDNTVQIARRTAFMIEKVKPILPSFAKAGGPSEEEQLAAQARAGLERRLTAQVHAPDMTEDARAAAARPYVERLEYELGVICQMGFAGYFLIVAEFIRWAREQGIPVGPGRGSGAGSVVAWSLTITDLDPIRFGLLFERFLNPERVSMPDFDIDFCQDRRDEVIRHVQALYGADRVAQIITFGKLQARAVLRDVGRVLGMPYGYVDKICKLVPNNPANPVTLQQAVAQEPRLKQMMDEDATVARLVDIARKLEGLYRHASTHAAGVVIGDRPLRDSIPLYHDPRSDMLVTGFNMKWVESAGLVKFDFLGLKTLTVLATAVRLIAETEGRTIDLSRIPLDDAATFRLLARGDTVGVFQLESSGMRDVLRKLRPDTFEDIIAVVALYRPGPMDNIPSYIRRKHGEEAIDFIDPSLKGILRETYGIIIYQEQVMQIAQELSGYSLGSADLLRRAMGKKIKEEMEQQRQAFVEGACARGVDRDKATYIFDLVNKFAGYGFNKSHAAAYALIAYQTAWLKANYPVAFFAASMILDMDHAEKIGGFRRELDRLGIRLLPPDINRSGVTFAPEADGEGGGAIRYGLAAVRNVGAGAMRAVVEERTLNGPFADLDSFARRIAPAQINRRVLENLVRAGAFDGIDGNRRRVFAQVEDMLRNAAVAADERASGQIGLFADGPADVAPRARVAAIPDWPPMERLAHEFDALGLYLSAHPLQAYERVLKRRRVMRRAEIGPTTSGVVTLAGTVIAKKERRSSRGSRYAFVELSDIGGSFEVTVFSEVLAGGSELLEVGTCLLIRATVQADGDDVRLTAESLEPLERVAERTESGVAIHLDPPEPLAAIHLDPPEPLDAIRSELNGDRTGSQCVKLIMALAADREVEIGLPGRYAIGPALIGRLRALPGVRDVTEF